MKAVGEATLLPMATLFSGALLHSLVPDISKAPPAPGGQWQCCAGGTNPCPPLPRGRWVVSGFHGRGWRRNGGKCVEMAPPGNSCILGASCLLQAPLGGSLGRALLVSKELLGAFSRDDIRVLGAWQYLRECPVTCGPPASLHVSPQLVTCCFAHQGVHPPNHLRCHLRKCLAVPSALTAAPGLLGLGCVSGAGASAWGRSSAANLDGHQVPTHCLRRLKAPTGYVLLICLC